ncbi:hypothetical protein [Ralstonia sp. A12]|uniref:hypothetical protein n=1 Tax=Ralstonia sp. A12 TaxID=1217052 RepID=UPI000A054689|nr:hypothetical protein [Ralstonia sp. A12]
MPSLSVRDIKTVLLVADVYQDEASVLLPEQRRDLEKSSPETIAAITKALNELGLAVLHLRSLEELYQRAAQRRRSDIVLSIFGGERSRNRMALVPAICESLGTRFIGPDTYGRVVCQDKAISKKLALDSGVVTPAHYLARTLSDLQRLTPTRFPLVVKPNLEGSSIGISQQSVVHSVAALNEVAQLALEEFGQPVLIEEFVAGREVSFNVIESVQGTHERFAEIRMVARPDYFNDHLFSADIKTTWSDIEVVALDDVLIEPDREALLRLIEAVGGIGYCRIDGKLLDGRFQLLELTPDAWLDPRGVFALSFTQTGWSYSEVLAHVLTSESEARRRLMSSG